MSRCGVSKPVFFRPLSENASAALKRFWSKSQVPNLFSLRVIDDTVHLFDLERSLGAFSAKRRNEQSEFDNKVEALTLAIAEQQADKADISSALLASQSGLSIDLLMRLKSPIDGDLGKLPVTVKAWLLWTTHWLSEDDDAREYLLFDVEGAIKGACGAKKQGRVTVEDIGQIQPGLLGWIEGFPISKIEAALGGEPGSDELTKQKCPRARELVGSVTPRRCCMERE